MARGTRKNLTTKPAVKNPSVEAVKEDVSVKNESVAAVKPTEVKAGESPKAVKKPGRKPAAKKTEVAVEKPAAKKRAPRKPKVVTADDVVAKISKRIDKSVASQLVPSGKAAVDIKLYGSFEAHMYIEIKDGSVNVAPYDYIEKDLEAAIPVDVALAIADGKTTIKEAVEDGSLYVFGNVQFALLFAKLFK